MPDARKHTVSQEFDPADYVVTFKGIVLEPVGPEVYKFTAEYGQTLVEIVPNSLDNAPGEGVPPAHPGTVSQEPDPDQGNSDA
jgi:hypothetical protein